MNRSKQKPGGSSLRTETEDCPGSGRPQVKGTARLDLGNMLVVAECPVCHGRAPLDKTADAGQAMAVHRRAARRAHCAYKAGIVSCAVPVMQEGLLCGRHRRMQ